MNTNSNGRCIMICDDEQEVRQYLDMALTCLGYRVETAENGNEALQCLQDGESEISLVLLDVIMPERDGLETLREIRRMNPTLPVIVVAGEYLPTNVVTAMKPCNVCRTVSRRYPWYYLTSLCRNGMGLKHCERL